MKLFDQIFQTSGPTFKINSSIIVFIKNLGSSTCNLHNLTHTKFQFRQKKGKKNKMGETKFNYLLLPLFYFTLCCTTLHVQPQPSTVGYNCTPSAQSTCATYVFYRATSPEFLDLASVADLFSVSRLMISHPSNISAPNATLAPGQDLLVPVTCSCNAAPNISAAASISYAALNYTILGGDTFYFVSTAKFQNLTTYQSVMAVNPTFVPTNLNIGDVIVFPIFCACPNSSQVGDRVNYLISYVFQPSDRLADVASRFGTSRQAIIDANRDGIRPSDTIFIPVSRLPNLTQPQPQQQQPLPPPPATNPLPPDRGSDNSGAVIGLGAGLGLCVAALIVVCGVWWRRERTMRKSRDFYREEAKKLGAEERGRNGISKGGEEGVNLMADVSGCLDKYKVFGIDDLKSACDGFADTCLIQGSVYKGRIDGEWFAVKKMKWNAYEELKILQKVNHGNLVRLEGFCIDPQEANCYLVYEYVENGSLHSWLHESGRAEKLSWKQRLKIAVDVANGLQYIHEHTRPRVVHKDIKSSNILLDSSMRAKIANFGLAKSGLNAITMHIVGTQGYIAPEYLSDGVVSTKMDVFAFGVVLLELVSGREAVDGLGPEAGRALEGSEEGRARRVREWMGECEVEGEDMESVVGVMGVAVACVSRDPARRPSMVEIVYALSKSGDMFFDASGEGFSPTQVVAR